MDEVIGDFIRPREVPTIVPHGQGKFEDDVLHLGTNEATGEPVLVSEKTGKYYTVRWADLCNLAVHAGISIIPGDCH